MVIYIYIYIYIYICNYEQTHADAHASGREVRGTGATRAVKSMAKEQVSRFH